MYFFHLVTLKKVSGTQSISIQGQSYCSTAEAIGIFVGGTVFGTLATLLVEGIVLGAVKMKQKEMKRR